MSNATSGAQRQVTVADRQRNERFTALRDLLEKGKGQLQAALPRHMNADRMIRVALTTYNRTPELANCSVQSIAQALMEAAQLGLEPDGVLGHAYLVPYKGQAKFICGYKGMIALAYNSGKVESVSGHVVRERDHFVFEFGLSERLEHRPYMDGDGGEAKAVYAVARMKDGGHAMVVLPKHEVERLRQRSAMPNSPAWKNDWDAMAVKTAVRQLSKWMPQCPELQRVVAREEAMEVGVDLEADEAIEVKAEAAATTPKPKAEQIAERVRADRKAAAPQQAQPTEAQAEELSGDDDIPDFGDADEQPSDTSTVDMFD